MKGTLKQPRTFLRHNKGILTPLEGNNAPLPVLSRFNDAKIDLKESFPGTQDYLYDSRRRMVRATNCSLGEPEKKEILENAWQIKTLKPDKSCLP